jgi:hypothetical protein
MEGNAWIWAERFMHLGQYRSAAVLHEQYTMVALFRNVVGVAVMHPAVMILFRDDHEQNIFRIGSGRTAPTAETPR